MMAANKSVIVLVPNGRRQNVKVTPNTTILQILEEVCQKHGYNAADFDIKHYNQVLDINAIFRFTGLPNNAQLEMINSTKVRRESDVIIGIQLENGERITKEFPPSTTLCQILEDLCPDQLLATTVLIYMHQEVHGREALDKTTLRSLGLSCGRAMFRLIHRNPEQLKSQAHVYVPLAPKPSRDAVASFESNNVHGTASSSSAFYPENKLDPITSSKTKETNPKKNYDVEYVEENRAESCQSNVKAKLVQQSEASISEDSAMQEEDNSSLPDSTQNIEERAKVEFLGERNALVFNQAGAQAIPQAELPDSFFDLTVEDARILLHDVKRRREEIEEAPLQTVSQRQLDRDKRILNQLHKYRRTVIRIQFPDQLVLQGLFGPLETVRIVKDFVKSYLTDPNSEFTLYTTPPRIILNSDARLVDEDLVPSAIIHYSGQSDLKPEVKKRLTDPIVASIQAVKSRMAMIRRDTESSSDQATSSNTNEASGRNKEPTPGPSNRRSFNQRKSEDQAPKWFKQPFK